MRDIINEVVAEMQRGPDQKLTGGWSRGCPTKREERALIEVWVSFVEKVAALYAADVGSLEAKVTKLSEDVAKASAAIANQERQGRQQDKDMARNAINNHIDRAGDALPLDAAQRLQIEANVA